MRENELHSRRSEGNKLPILVEVGLARDRADFFERIWIQEGGNSLSNPEFVVGLLAFIAWVVEVRGAYEALLGLQLLEGML